VSLDSHGDAGWGKLLTCPPELSGNPTSSNLGANRKNGRRRENFAYSASEIPQGIF
jgi:hypothetical protein